MKTLDVFDPPMCCSSGVCGPSVDPVLPRFVADLHWLANQGVRVRRHNMAHEPQAFSASEAVRSALLVDGNACLPLVLVNGDVASKGAYPDRKQLAQWMGIEIPETTTSASFPAIQTVS